MPTIRRFSGTTLRKLEEPFAEPVHREGEIRVNLAMLAGGIGERAE